ncbi:unnamed protein product [Closterium sp. Naga37s-1]|nr:unnamed protein product [Closterium sp. Naga37s-1]
MVFTLKIGGCAMDYQDGALPDDKAQHRMYSNRLARLFRDMQHATHMPLRSPPPPPGAAPHVQQQAGAAAVCGGVCVVRVLPWRRAGGTRVQPEAVPGVRRWARGECGEGWVRERGGGESIRAVLVGPVFNFKLYQVYAAGQGVRDGSGGERKYVAGHKYVAEQGVKVSAGREVKGKVELWSPSGAVVPSKTADTSKGEEGQQAQNGNGEADRAQGESKGEKVCEGKGEGKLRKMPEPLPYAAQALGKAIIFLAMHHFLSQHFGPALLFQPRFLTYGFAYK